MELKQEKQKEPFLSKLLGWAIFAYLSLGFLFFQELFTLENQSALLFPIFFLITFIAFATVKNKKILLIVNIVSWIYLFVFASLLGWYW